MFYNAYTSPYNKESISHLKYGMVLSDFVEFQEFIDTFQAIDDGTHLDAAKEKARREAK